MSKHFQFYGVLSYDDRTGLNLSGSTPGIFLCTGEGPPTYGFPLKTMFYTEIRWDCFQSVNPTPSARNRERKTNKEILSLIKEVPHLVGKGDFV